MRAIDFVDSYFDAWNHSDAKGLPITLLKMVPTAIFLPINNFLAMS